MVALVDALVDALLVALVGTPSASPEAIVGAMGAAGTGTSTEGSAKVWLEVFASAGAVIRFRFGRVNLGTSTGWKFNSGQLLGECGGV